MKNAKRKNYIWLILSSLIVIFLIIFIIFRLFKNNELNCKDWLAFIGSYLGFSGSVVLSYVAIYQNQIIRDSSEKQYKNAIQPIINFEYKKIHLLNLVDMREYFHHFQIKNETIIDYTQIIPRDIYALHREFLDLKESGANKSISDDEYKKIQNRYQNNLSKLSKKYLLLDCFLDNNGNGNAINIELLLNNKKLTVSPSLQSNKYNGFLFLIETTRKQNVLNFDIKLIYENIDKETFTNHIAFNITRDINGQLTVIKK